MVLQRSLWSLLCFRYYQHLIIPACLPADTVCVPFRVICNSWCLSRGVKERELTPSSGISSAFVAMSTKPAPNTQWPICFDGSRVYRWHSKMPCVQLRDPQHIWFSSVTSSLSIVNCLKHTWKMTFNKVETITFQFTGIYYKNRIGWNGQLVKNKNAIVSLIKLKSSPVFSVPSVLSGSFPRNLEGFLSFTLNSVRSGNKA